MGASLPSTNHHGPDAGGEAPGPARPSTAPPTSSLDEQQPEHGADHGPPPTHQARGKRTLAEKVGAGGSFEGVGDDDGGRPGGLRGEGYELDAIAAVVIGGHTLRSR